MNTGIIPSLLLFFHLPVTWAPCWSFSGNGRLLRCYVEGTFLRWTHRNAKKIEELHNWLVVEPSPLKNNGIYIYMVIIWLMMVNNIRLVVEPTPLKNMTNGQLGWLLGIWHSQLNGIVIIHSCSEPPSSYNMLYLSYNPFIDRITHIFCDKPNATGSMFQTTNLQQSFYPLLPHDIQVLSITESHATQVVTGANAGPTQ